MAEGAEDALRAMQQELVAQFDPGELVYVDVPHYMEPVIPEQIAEELEQVIAAT